MGSVQATLRTWTDEGGTVVLDDGRVLPFERTAVVGVRLLHPGQRVRLRVEDGAVTALTLSTFPLP